MAIYYKTNGEVKEVKPKNNKTFQYEELKAMVDGLVEIVPLPSGKSIIVNEEGKIIGLEVNKKATEYWKKEYPIEEYPNNNDELIVGNALVVDELEIADDD